MIKESESLPEAGAYTGDQGANVTKYFIDAGLLSFFLLLNTSCTRNIDYYVNQTIEYFNENKGAFEALEPTLDGYSKKQLPKDFMLACNLKLEKCTDRDKYIFSKNGRENVVFAKINNTFEYLAGTANTPKNGVFDLKITYKNVDSIQLCNQKKWNKICQIQLSLNWQLVVSKRAINTTKFKEAQSKR